MWSPVQVLTVHVVVVWLRPYYPCRMVIILALMASLPAWLGNASLTATRRMLAARPTRNVVALLVLALVVPVTARV